MNRTLCFVTPAVGESPHELQSSLRNLSGPFVNLPVLPSSAPAWTGQTVPLFQVTGPERPIIEGFGRSISHLLAELHAIAGSVDAALDAIEAASAFAGGMAGPLATALERIKPSIAKSLPNVSAAVRWEIETTILPILNRGPDRIAPLVVVRIERRLYWIIQTVEPLSSRPTASKLAPYLRAAELYLKKAIAPAAVKIVRRIPVVTTVLDTVSAGVKVFNSKDSFESTEVIGNSMFATVGGAVALVLVPASVPLAAGILLGGLAGYFGQHGGKILWKNFYRNIPDSTKRAWILPSP